MQNNIGRKSLVSTRLSWLEMFTKWGPKIMINVRLYETIQSSIYLKINKFGISVERSFQNVICYQKTPSIIPRILSNSIVEIELWSRHAFSLIGFFVCTYADQKNVVVKSIITFPLPGSIRFETTPRICTYMSIPLNEFMSNKIHGTLTT